jgi:hypothetical protein
LQGTCAAVKKRNANLEAKLADAISASSSASASSLSDLSKELEQQRALAARARQDVLEQQDKVEQMSRELEDEKNDKNRKDEMIAEMKSMQQRALGRVKEMERELTRLNKEVAKKGGGAPAAEANWSSDRDGARVVSSQKGDPAFSSSNIAEPSRLSDLLTEAALGTRESGEAVAQQSVDEASSIGSSGAWLVISVDLGGDRGSSDIEVRYGDNPQKLAEAFCKRENLPAETIESVADYLASNIEDEQASMRAVLSPNMEGAETDDDELTDVEEFEEGRDMVLRGVPG